MSYWKKIDIQAADSPSIDAFGRWRVSNPEAVFDSKQLNTDQPFLWDDQEVSGAATSSTFDSNKAATTMSVSNGTAGKRVRQTYEFHNYQPGKSQFSFLTFGSLNATSGIIKEAGYFYENDGIFVRNTDGTTSVNLRSSVTGSPATDTKVQSEWNLDTLDGNGPSGVTLDPDNTEIFIIDFQYLGVGRVRVGFDIDGIAIYCHQFLNANNKPTVYMSSPNLPLRYSIENDGTGTSDSFDHICSAVISEGGQQDKGLSRYISTEGNAIQANSSGTLYAACGIRLKSNHREATIKLKKITALTKGVQDDFEWQLRLNPTITGTFVYSEISTDSCVEAAIGTVGSPAAPTVSGGTKMDGGMVKSDVPAASPVDTKRNIGSNIGGTVDEIVLCVRPLSANQDIEASLTWLEVS
jgi:hypothetical protein